jgi:hypothetical protein
MQTSENNTDLLKQIETIRTTQPGNLMARYFDRVDFGSLNPEMRDRLVRVIRSGLENPDSQMGVYTQDSSDYEVFSSLFDPMIRDYHGVADAMDIAQRHHWGLTAQTCNLAEIDPALADVSMRVRVGRNLSCFPMAGGMTKSHRLEFETLMVTAFEALKSDPQFSGQYLSLTPGSAYAIDEETYQSRVQAHQMFKDMSGDPYLASGGVSSDWPYGRGMYVSDTDDFLVWVGEEDHLRIMAMGAGGDLSGLFKRLHDGLEVLVGQLPTFAHSQQYGYLTSCPSNLGTAMRASLHLKLPKLTANGSDLEPAKDAASEFGLSVRGAGGEHSDAGMGGLVDISPRARLGVTETEIMQRLYDGAAALWGLENKE